MDKYEYRLKTEHIKRLAAKKDYASAVKICDGIDWNKVKDVKMLTAVSDIYEAVGRYQEAIDVLIQAYQYAPIGRRIVYRLTELAVDCGNYKDAEEYYEEFCNIAPNDMGKIILNYKLEKAKGAKVEELIKILETYKEEDFDERWSYELAELYAKAGRKQDCVSLCDDIILWFGLGKYVDKALYLKAKFAPLSEVQRQKLKNGQHFYEEESNVTFVQLPDEEQEHFQAELAESVVSITEDGDREEKETPVTIQVEEEVEDKEKELESSAYSEVDTAIMEETSEPDVLVNDKQEELTEDAVLEAEMEEPDSTEDRTDEEKEDKVVSSVESSLVDFVEESEEPMEESEKEMEEESEVEEVSEPLNGSGFEEKPVAEELKESEQVTAIESQEEFVEESEEKFDYPVQTELEKDKVSDSIEHMEVDKEAEEDTEKLESEGEERSENQRDTEMDQRNEEKTEEAGQLTFTEPGSFSVEEQIHQLNEMIQKNQAIGDQAGVSRTIDKKEEPATEKEEQVDKVSTSIESDPVDESEVWHFFVKSNSPEEGFRFTVDKLRSMRDDGKNRPSTIARTKGNKLNGKSIIKTLDKLLGKTVIVEEAGGLGKEVLEEFSMVLDKNDRSLIVVFIDTEEQIDRIIRENPKLAEVFSAQFYAKTYSMDDLMEYAKAYADGKDCAIDESARLFVTTKLEKILKENPVGWQSQVEKMLDAAVDKGNKKSVGRALKGLFVIRYDDDGRLLLKEEDFN